MQISFSPHITSIYILYRASFSVCSARAVLVQTQDLTSVSTHTQTPKSSYHPGTLFCPPCNQPVSRFCRAGRRKKLFFGTSNMAAILDVSLCRGHWTGAREGEKEADKESWGVHFRQREREVSIVAHFDRRVCGGGVSVHIRRR